MPNSQHAETPDPVEFQRIGEIVRHNLTYIPRSIAVTHGEKEWDWTDWDARIRHVVTGLRSDRLKRGERIAVLDRNDPVCLEALFAASNMGLACTFVDPFLRPQEIAYALNESEARFLFLAHEHEELHSEISLDLDTVVTTVTFGGGADDEYEEWLEAHEPHEAMMKAAREIAATQGEDVVLRIYKSDGRKGPTRAEYTHRDILAACSEAVRRKEVKPDDVAVIDEPLTHYTATVRAISAMAAGAVTTLVRET